MSLGFSLIWKLLVGCAIIFYLGRGIFIFFFIVDRCVVGTVCFVSKDLGLVI